VIAGFEPLDVMQAILMLVRQVNEGRAEVENEFTRAVTRDGNLKAQALVAEVFELRAVRVARAGRGADSALRIRREVCALRRRARFALEYQPVPDNKACECGAILRGVKKPQDCKLVRHRVHAGEPDGLVHGVVGRRLRGALHLRPLPRRPESRQITG
jgi:hydrogenase expression/formation protein HypD